MTNISALSPKEKAAILLVTLGEEYSAELFKHLSCDEIDEITRGLSITSRISAKEKEQVVKEFYEICLARKLISDGGIDYARGILESALGRSKTQSLLFGQGAAPQETPLWCIQDNPDDLNIGLPVEMTRSTFAFEDITKLSGSTIRRALRDVSSADLAIALNLSSKDISKAVFSNIPRRQQEQVKSEMEHMGPVRVRDAQEARRRIVDTIRELEDEGEIEIVRNLQDAFIA